MVKKIKSFTVDETAYDALVRLFKKSGASVSVSLFVNNCLNDLAHILSEMEETKKISDYTVPMSYVIERLLKRADLFGIKDWLEEEGFPSMSDVMLYEFEQDYEAEQKGIPPEYYSFLKSGLFILSPNKKYLIEKGTGKKMIAVTRGQLVPVD